jgi:hypothetical protein
MMSGNSGYGYLRGIAFIALGLLQVTAAQADWTIPGLMHALAANAHPNVHFKEIKSLAYLDAALTSHGVLSVDPAGQLIKETTSPQYERLIIDNDTVHSMREGEDEVTLLLSDFPVIRGFVEAFRATLQGDLETLSRYYLLALQGSEDSWSLQLRPQQASLAAAVRLIDVTGASGRITSFTVEEQSGDYTTLTMTEQ